MSSIMALAMHIYVYIDTYRVGNSVDGLRDTTVLLLLCRGAIFALVIGIYAQKAHFVTLPLNNMLINIMTLM